MIGYFRYVPHHRMLDYFRVGWMWDADLGPVHGQWSCLMSWPCNCKCVEPI